MSRLIVLCRLLRNTGSTRSTSRAPVTSPARWKITSGLTEAIIREVASVSARSSCVCKVKLCLVNTVVASFGAVRDPVHCRSLGLVR